MTNGEQRFTAVVHIDGINPYVDVPKPIVQALGGEAKAAVLVRVAVVDPQDPNATLEFDHDQLAGDAERLVAIGRLTGDGWFRTTLVPRRANPTRLYLDTWMRRTAGAAVGSRVRVTLKLDCDPRHLALPPALAAALDADAAAQAAWETLTPSRRREILTYLNFLKTPAALERNVRKVLKNLLEPEKSNN